MESPQWSRQVHSSNLNNSDLWCTFRISWSLSFCPGKIFNFVPDNGAKNVSVGSHSWIAYRSRAQRPSVFMSRFDKWAIKWVETRGNITLTRRLDLVRKEQRRSGILTSASGLIKRWTGGRLRKKGEQKAMGNRLVAVCRGKTLNVGSPWFRASRNWKQDLTGSSNSKSFSVKEIIGTD